MQEINQIKKEFKGINDIQINNSKEFQNDLNGIKENLSKKISLDDFNEIFDNKFSDSFNNQKIKIHQEIQNLKNELKNKVSSNEISEIKVNKQLIDIHNESQLDNLVS